MTDNIAQGTFTYVARGIASVLITPVFICAAYDPQGERTIQYQTCLDCPHTSESGIYWDIGKIYPKLVFCHITVPIIINKRLDLD